MAKTINYDKIKKDMQDWPNRWAGTNADIPVGNKIIQAMEPFLLAMKDDGLAVTTVNRHLTNLWLLGGEIISRLYDDPKLRKADGNQLLLEFVEEEGGPLSKHISTEEEQRGFDGTCRKLYRFLKKESNG